LRLCFDYSALTTSLALSRLVVNTLIGDFALTRRASFSTSWLRRVPVRRGLVRFLGLPIGVKLLFTFISLQPSITDNKALLKRQTLTTDIYQFHNKYTMGELIDFEERRRQSIAAKAADAAEAEALRYRGQPFSRIVMDRMRLYIRNVRGEESDPDEELPKISFKHVAFIGGAALTTCLVVIGGVRSGPDTPSGSQDSVTVCEFSDATTTTVLDRFGTLDGMALSVDGTNYDTCFGETKDHIIAMNDDPAKAPRAGETYYLPAAVTETARK
jgi:hypothetical protein